MPPPRAEARRAADDALRVSLARADRIVTGTDPAGRTRAIALLDDLAAADAELRRRLARAGGDPEARFTTASHLAYQRQIATVLARARAQLGGHVTALSTAAVERSMRDTVTLLSRLEGAYTGISRPLRLHQASVMNPLIERTEHSLLAAHATSVDRYGTAMIGEYERRMRQGLIRGATQGEMVDELCGTGGPSGVVSIAGREEDDGTVTRIRTAEIPEGLFTRYRSWAWRIVRTETARAYSEARLQGLFAAREADFPALKKKILAHFDNRTAPDSIAVHGQVRPLEGLFVDGAGREYLRPPARPNDRETVIPWQDDWHETEITSPRPAGTVATAILTASGADRDRGLRYDQRQRVLAAIRADRAARAQKLRDERAARRAAARPIATPSATSTARPPVPPQHAAPPIAPHLVPITPAEFCTELATALNEVETSRPRRGRGSGGGRLIRGNAAQQQRHADAQVRARTALRRLVHSELGLDSTDELARAYGRPPILSVGHDVPDGAAGVHGWHGDVRVTETTFADARRELAVDPEVRRRYPANGLRVLVHEELHGTSSIARAAYRGYGAAIEEATVELVARRLTRRAIGDTHYRHVAGSPGAYNGTISAIVRDVRATHPELADATDEVLAERIEQAAIRTWRRGQEAIRERGVTSLDSNESYADVFIEELGYQRMSDAHEAIWEKAQEWTVR